MYIGIDVAKREHEVYVRPSGERWTVGADSASVAGLVERVRALPVTLIVLEASGGAGRGARRRPACSSAWRRGP